MKNASSTEQSCMCLKYLLFCCEMKYLFTWERMLFEDIPFPPFGQAYYTNNILLNTELFTSVKDWYLGSPRTQKKLEEHLLGSFLFLDSEVFIGYRAEKKTEKNSKKIKKTKETKKNVLGEMLCLKIFFYGIFFCFSSSFFVFFPRKLSSATRLRKKTKKSNKTKNTKETKKKSFGRNGEMLCPRVSSRGCFFLFFLVCLVFFWFFSSFFVFSLGSFHRLQAWEKNKTNSKKPKKTKKQKKNKVLGKSCAQGFPPQDCFFVFFDFVQVFCFFTRMFSSATSLRKKQNKLEENLKNKKTSLGKNVVPKGFLRGIVFFLFFFCFFGFLVFFNFFWFMILEFVWHMSDIITKTHIFGRYKNQSHHFNWHGPAGATKPHNYSMEIARAHRLPFRQKTPLLIAMTKLK